MSNNYGSVSHKVRAGALAETVGKVLLSPAYELLPQVEVTYNVTRMGDNDSDDGVNEAIIAGVIAGVVFVMAVVVFGIYRDTEI